MTVHFRSVSRADQPARLSPLLSYLATTRHIPGWGGPEEVIRVFCLHMRTLREKNFLLSGATEDAKKKAEAQDTKDNAEKISKAMDTLNFLTEGEDLPKAVYSAILLYALGAKTNRRQNPFKDDPDARRGYELLAAARAIPMIKDTRIKDVCPCPDTRLVRQFIIAASLEKSAENAKSGKFKRNVPLEFFAAYAQATDVVWSGDLPSVKVAMRAKGLRNAINALKQAQPRCAA